MALNLDTEERVLRRIGKPRLFLFFGAIVVLILGNTLAANISLNSGGNVEFGQGVALTTACDNDVTVTPYSTFINEEGAGDFMFTSISVTGISEDCDGKIFTIKAYEEGSDDPLDLYITDGTDTYNSVQVSYSMSGDEGAFTLVDAGLLSDDIYDRERDEIEDSDGFTVELFTSDIPSSEALASARDVDRITIESRDGDGPSPTPSPSPSPIYNFWTTEGTWAGYSANFWGQTFTIPVGAAGGITSISGIKLIAGCLLDDDSVIQSTVRIYSDPGKTTLLATATNTLEVVDDCANGSFGTTADLTANFSEPIPVVEGQQYFFELEKTTPWFGNFYFLGSDTSYVYEGGAGYTNGTERTIDLSFRVNFGS